MRKTTIQMNMVQFKAAVMQVQSAMGVRDVRYYLNAIHIETVSEGWVRLVAANGHRLHCSDAVKGDIYHELDAPIPKNEWLIPGQHINIVKSLLNKRYGEYIRVEFTDQRCKVSTLLNPYGNGSPQDLSFEMSHVGGAFPEFKKVVEESFNGHTFKCKTQVLLDALVAYKVYLPKHKVQNIGITFVPEKDHSVILDYEGDPVHTAAFEIQNDSSIPMGLTVRTGMNIQYLIDMLKAVKTQAVQFTISDDRGSIAFETTLNRDAGLYGLIMPCRVPDKDSKPVEDEE